MKHPLVRLLSFILLALAVTACGRSIIYKVPVQQGNILEQDDVDELRPGMTKRQVSLVMGTPAIADPFHNDRWDYVYTSRTRGRLQEENRLTLYFADDKLTRMEGDFLPENSEEVGVSPEPENGSPVSAEG